MSSISRFFAAVWPERPWISILELGDALAQLRLLAGAGAPAKLEQVLLAGERAGDVGVGAAPEELAREDDLVDVVALGLETGEPRLQLVQALHHDGEVCLSDSLVEPHDDVAGLDLVAVADPQLADDAAGRVLDLLDVRIDHDEARCDHGARKLGRRRKPADAAGEQGHDGDPADEMAPDRAL